MSITGQMQHIQGQVNQNAFTSDDPATMPNGVNMAVLDAVVNLKSGMAVWRSTATFVPEGGGGTFEGIGGGWFKPDGSSKGWGTFQGTGSFAGQTLKMDLTAGDIRDCPGAPFAATVWSGFIVPPSE
jgi:hypothetical protein